MYKGFKDEEFLKCEIFQCPELEDWIWVPLFEVIFWLATTYAHFCKHIYSVFYYEKFPSQKASLDDLTSFLLEMMLSHARSSEQNFILSLSSTDQPKCASFLNEV